MANVTLSGYLAAAASVSWTGGQSLNSALDAEWTTLSDEIDNTTNKYLQADLQIDLASAAFTGADAGLEIYLIPSVDGTNYPAWTGDVTTEQQGNMNYFIGFVAVPAVTAAQRMVLRGVALPSGKYRWALRNQTNVALAASGNTMQWRPFSYAG